MPLSTTFSILRITLLISLVLTTASSVVPAMITPVLMPAFGVLQSGPTAWSPFGPQQNDLLITVYSDFSTMFTAFVSGQIDLTDWPVQPQDLDCSQPPPAVCFQNRPDFFVTEPESQTGQFQLDFNHFKPFMGKAQQQSRTTGTPSLTVDGTSTGCTQGFGQLRIQPRNMEEANAIILDPLNKVRLSGPVPTVEVNDDPAGGSSVDGVYVLPGPTICTLAGTYTISTTVYSGSATVSIGSQQIVTATLRVNYNSPSVLEPTQAGIEIRRAIAHIHDKIALMGSESLAGGADYNDIQAAGAQGLIVDGVGNAKLPPAVLAEDCASHPWFTPCNSTSPPVSAYNLQLDNIGGGGVWWGLSGAVAFASKGYSGVNDLRAACDHFVAAGFTIAGATDPTRDDCLEVALASLGTVARSTYPHLVPTGQVVDVIRTHPPRQAQGQIIADAINFIFGTPNNGGTVCYGSCPRTTPQYFTITQIFDQVFGGPPVSPVDDWDIYTGGFTGSPFAEQFFQRYSSFFTGNACAGQPLSEPFPSNYVFYCNSQLDSDAAAGEFSSSLSEANAFIARAAKTAHRTVATVPYFSLIQQFVALNGWNFQPSPRSSLVNVLGAGFQSSFWSVLNMRPRPEAQTVCTSPNNPPGCTTNSIYRPGGGSPNLVRRGFSQDVHKLSMFHFLTLWDFEVLVNIYDSMLALNPLTGGTGVQVIDWQTTSHTSSFNPSEVSCIGTNCVSGTTTQIWQLRNDLKWHDHATCAPALTSDGVLCGRVTAYDVAYSILAYRNVPSSNLQPTVATVVSAVALNPTTLQVKLQQKSPFYELGIGGLPIIPKHVWAPVCGDPPNPASICSDPGFDPMAAGLMIGDGPWVCKNLVSGVVGGSCTQNADGSPGLQDIVLDGRVRFERFDDYHRGAPQVVGSSLHKASYADKASFLGNSPSDIDDDGKVDILDLADAASVFGLPDAYWDSALFGDPAQVGVVDIVEIALIAFYFDHGITKPFLPSQLTGLDADIDPFYS